MQQVSSFDVSGREVFAEAVSCAFTPIKMQHTVENTSIRTDVSGSQGSAEEVVPEGRILLDPRVKPNLGAKFSFAGAETFTSTVEIVKPIYDMAGLLHHYQVDLKFV